MQGRKAQKPDPSVQDHANSATHTPQQWLRQSSNRSVPNLARQQHHHHRALGFSSIRDLARSSRRPLALQSTNATQPPDHTLRASNSLYGTLRDQCSPPPSPALDLSAPSAVVLRRSHSSSANSLTLDQSGLSVDSSHPTTPSPAKHLTFYELESSDILPSKDMGNKASTIVKKPLSIAGKRSGVNLNEEQEQSSEPSPSKENEGPATFSPRVGSPLAVQVPRRRSSLTVLHLDNSHFETEDPKQPNLQRRASTTSHPLGQSPNTLTETLRPAISNASILTPLNVAQSREKTLSPPVISPTSRLSSASSLSPTMAAPSNRTSIMGSRIHLPKTFPDGPVPIVAPQLTHTHYHCYTGHKRMLPSKNASYLVPCMVCAANPSDMWKCVFCYLRICPACMAVFDARKRNLQALVQWMEKPKNKDAEGMKEVVSPNTKVEDFALKKGGDDKGKEAVLEKEAQELVAKRAETAKKRETR